MSRPGIILIVLLVGFVALAQPGLCPCWLMLDISAHHPHPDGHPERPHSHGYLADLFQTDTVAAIPLLVVPAQTLIAQHALGALWWRVPNREWQLTGWMSAMEPPPPRAQKTNS